MNADQPTASISLFNPGAQIPGPGQTGFACPGPFVGLAAAARLLPPNCQGRPLNPSTLTRWITKGVIGPNGQRVRLSGVRCGGRWLTSLAALERFSAALTPPAPEPLTLVRAPAERTRASRLAEAELVRCGM